MKKRGEYYITQFFYLNLQTLIFIEKKMKQLKFLVVALTLLMGISFTSCLNSDSDPYNVKATTKNFNCFIFFSINIRV